jgi:hypothetical protein
MTLKFSFLVLSHRLHIGVLPSRTLLQTIERLEGDVERARPRIPRKIEPSNLYVDKPTSVFDLLLESMEPAERAYNDYHDHSQDDNYDDSLGGRQFTEPVLPVLYRKINAVRFVQNLYPSHHPLFLVWVRVRASIFPKKQPWPQGNRRGPSGRTPPTAQGCCTCSLITLWICRQ